MLQQADTSIVPSRSQAPLTLSIADRLRQSSPRRQDSLLEILWRQRRLMLCGAIASLMLGLIYVTFATREYTSTSRLMVSRGRPSILDGSHEAPPSDDDNFLSTQREVVASAPVLALAVSSPAVHDLRTFAGQSGRLEFLKKKLSVEVGKKVDLLSVSFEGPYPQEDSIIVAAVVKAYMEFENAQSQNTAAEAKGVLDRDKSTWEAELTQKSAALQSFCLAHGLTAGQDSAQNAEGRLHSISDALVTAHLEAATARIQYDQANDQLQSNPELQKLARDNAPADTTLASPEDLELIRQELAIAKTRARELQRDFMPGHPWVLSAIKRVQQLELEQIAALKMAAASTAAKEADLRSLYEQEQRAAIDQSAASAEAARLQADVLRLQQMVDSVDRRTHELDLASDDAAVTISVLEAAHTDDHPSKPQKVTSLAMSLFAGLMLAAVSACYRDRHDRRLSTAHDAQALLGLKVLGEIPAMPVEMSPSDRAQQAFLAPESECAAAYRALRTSLLYTDSAEAPRTILIASAGSGEGRSTVASNLAISLTEMGKRVLLVDADLRSPMQDWIFGIQKSGGLVAAINKFEKAGADHPPVGQESGVNRLDVLPAGHAVPDAPRLLNSSGFVQLLETLSELYDHVIIDSPSISGGPEARIISAHCETSLLVIREGETSLRAAEQAVSALQSVAANLAGVVLNRIPTAGKFRELGLSVLDRRSTAGPSDMASAAKTASYEPSLHAGQVVLSAGN